MTGAHVTTVHIHEWCGQVHDPDRDLPCPCVRGDIEVRRARTAVSKRHRASVELARVSDRLTRRAAA